MQRAHIRLRSKQCDGIQQLIRDFLCGLRTDKEKVQIRDPVNA